MGLRKDVKKIMSEINDIKTNLLPNTAYRASKYIETKEMLSNIELKISNIVQFIDDHGNKGLKIYYEISPVFLLTDDNGEWNFNPTFRSINMLNLVKDKDDIDKLILEMRKIKK